MWAARVISGFVCFFTCSNSIFRGHFWAYLVTCCDLSVFFYSFEVSFIDSSELIDIFSEVLNFNQCCFLNLTDSEEKKIYARIKRRCEVESFGLMLITVFHDAI